MTDIDALILEREALTAVVTDNTVTANARLATIDAELLKEQQRREMAPWSGDRVLCPDCQSGDLASIIHDDIAADNLADVNAAAGRRPLCAHIERKCWSCGITKRELPVDDPEIARRAAEVDA